jgi:hypothetical protein
MHLPPGTQAVPGDLFVGPFGPNHVPNVFGTDEEIARNWERSERSGGRAMHTEPRDLVLEEGLSRCHGGSVFDRVRPARGDVSAPLSLRSTRPEGGQGRRIPQKTRRLDQRPAPGGATWRDPHGGSGPDRIRPKHVVSTPLDRTCGGRGRHTPANPRRLDQRPAPGGATWRDLHGTGISDRIRSIHGGVSASLRSARHDLGWAGEADPPENTSSRPKSRLPSGRRGETPTEPAVPIVSG